MTTKLLQDKKQKYPCLYKMRIQTYKEKVDLVQPVEKIKPTKMVYNEKKQDKQKRQPKINEGGLDVLV